MIITVADAVRVTPADVYSAVTVTGWSPDTAVVVSTPSAPIEANGDPSLHEGDTGVIDPSLHNAVAVHTPLSPSFSDGGQPMNCSLKLGRLLCTGGGTAHGYAGVRDDLSPVLRAVSPVI